MEFSQDEEDYNLSLSKFESMLKTNKVFFFDSEEFEEIILHYMDTGRINLAKKALKLALDQHPKSTSLKLVQVEMLVYEDKIDQAERILNELYSIEPTNEEIYIQKANICSKKDQHEQAIDFLKIALQFTEDFADVYSMIGMEYLFMDKLEEAKESFIKCLEQDKEDYSALYNVVYCFDFLDQNEQAVVYLLSYIETNPYCEVAWHQLGRQYHILKNYEKAVWAFDYATLIDETFLGAYLEKAKALEKLKRYEEAIESYKITITLDDATSYAYLRLGKCYEMLGQKNKALKYFSKAVHEDPLLDKAWIAITDFYIRQNDFYKALHYVNKAIAIDNENYKYWKRFATINKCLLNYEEAEFGYRNAINYGDIEIDTFIYLSEIITLFQEYETAVQVLLQGLAYYPESYEIEYRLAGLYYSMKDTKSGKFHLIIALEKNNNHTHILKDLFPKVWKLKTVQNCIRSYLI